MKLPGSFSTRLAVLGSAALLTLPAAWMLSTPLSAAISNGQRASNFILTNSLGKKVQLEDFKGRVVVLEWHNPGCPYVQKHYNSGNMQSTQQAARKMGVVWLTINSGAPGKQGHMSPAEAEKLRKSQKAHSNHYLLDGQGHVGKAYGASATPHMYIIDSTGKLVYQGAIDDKPTADKADIKDAQNYVLSALKEIRAGKKVSKNRTRAYGCSVKYAS